MTRYTVTYTRRALDALARVWLASPDRPAITKAGDDIDRVLGRHASREGIPTFLGMRQLIVPPLIAEFTVEENDRIVTVWWIRHVGELTNGH